MPFSTRVFLRRCRHAAVSIYQSFNPMSRMHTTPCLELLSLICPGMLRVWLVVYISDRCSEHQPLRHRGPSFNSYTG